MATTINYLHLKRSECFHSFIYKFYPRIFHTKIGQKWPSSSGKEDFKKLVRCYYYFAIITPWRLAWTFESGSVVLEP